ncbi:hypothetical protein D3C71_1566570 [compost metagenome]
MDIESDRALDETDGERRVLWIAPRDCDRGLLQRGSLHPSISEADRRRYGRGTVRAARMQLNARSVPHGLRPFQGRSAHLILHTSSAKGNGMRRIKETAHPLEFRPSGFEDDAEFKVARRSVPCTPGRRTPIGRSHKEVPLGSSSKEVELRVAPSRIRIVMLLRKARVVGKALEFHVVRLQRSLRLLGKSPAIALSPRMFRGNPLHMDFF